MDLAQAFFFFYNGHKGSRQRTTLSVFGHARTGFALAFSTSVD